MTERILVTGATGFLGGHLARHLAAEGRCVVATGRNERRGHALEKDGIQFRPADLANASATETVCADIDVVVHCAAMSTAWAPREHFVASNIDATRNLLAAGRSLRRFIHVSTPAVMSRYEHQYGLSEDTPLPATFTSLYGETKAAAEELVRRQRRVETAIVRPKAIYGPGDRALLPRLVDAARSGRLRIVGDGTTVTHPTHIDDVVAALTAAIDARAVSGTYHVAGPETINLWEMIETLLPQLGLEAPRRSISIGRAMRIGRILETAWSTLRLRGEPPLTRYKAAVLGYSQTLDTSRIATALGYQPSISLGQGLDSVLSALGTEP